MCSASFAQSFKMLAAVVFLLLWTAHGTWAQVKTTERPRDCQDLIQQGKTYESHYVVYPEISGAPNKPTIIYCSQNDGMDPLPSDRKPARNCLDLLHDGMTYSGTNVIYPLPDHPADPVLVYCDQDRDGGGWAIIQKRYDGGVNFYRDWVSYAEGFGNVAEEHYLGNNNIAALTGQSVNELMVDLEDWSSRTAYAHYQVFHVANASFHYQMQVTLYDGNAGDSFQHDHVGQYFSTYDRDYDATDIHDCAEERHGGWWYWDCASTNLNGRYYPSADAGTARDGLEWRSFRGDSYSLKKTQMMVRPQSCIAA